MVESYNETKFGVDITDQMAKNIESNQDQEDSHFKYFSIF